jgi:hypothetical protein
VKSLKPETQTLSSNQIDLKKLEGRVIALDLDIIYNIYQHLKTSVVDERNSVFVLKHDFIIEDGCGARHRIYLKMPVTIELGLKLNPISYEEIRNVFPIALENSRYFKRELFNVAIYVYDQNIKYYPRNPSSLKAFIPVTLRDSKLIPVKANEADYAILLFTNKVSSKSFDAKLDINGEVEYVCKDTTSCARESLAAALVIVRKGARISITLNDPPFRGQEDHVYTRHFVFDGVNLIETFDYSVPII